MASESIHQLHHVYVATLMSRNFITVVLELNSRGDRVDYDRINNFTVPVPSHCRQDRVNDRFVSDSIIYFHNWRVWSGFFLGASEGGPTCRFDRERSWPSSTATGLVRSLALISSNQTNVRKVAVPLVLGGAIIHVFTGPK
jgi:hypothetical protein